MEFWSNFPGLSWTRTAHYIDEIIIDKIEIIRNNFVQGYQISLLFTEGGFFGGGIFIIYLKLLARMLSWNESK